MKVIEKNEGPKIAYSVNKTKLNINDELIIDLAKYERDDVQHKDVCMDSWDCLVMGLGTNYVLQIDIPARTYELVDTGKTDPETKAAILDRRAVPFSMDNVTITLWALSGAGQQEVTYNA